MSLPRIDSNKDTKDARLLLPAMLTPRVAPLQKIFIDDLTMDRRHRQWRVPWFILLMCFVQISLHHIADQCMQRRLIYRPESRHEYWRYFTYMLLHADAWHLAINMCLQFFVGVWLELEQGHWRVAVVYIAGGICGALANAWLQPELLLLGASAGVYAMLCSHVPHLVLNFKQLSHRYVRIAVILILLMCDAAFTAFHFCINHNRNPRISLEAHLGGVIAGLMVGYLAYRRLLRKKSMSTSSTSTSASTTWHFWGTQYA
ncbi:protein rhomboid [Drosophila sulfurigaster albostrigata]|uniref:protein rhomboid n=1 Tax=Drosophila sulfurigaster albostrigata TaxID=89887 RepID=UPI002D21D960|nr:protein rhomboid [Drosophila sulfurigaster albostrigata]